MTSGRSDPVGLGGIPGLGQPPDDGAGIARTWLPQDIRPSAPSRAGRRRYPGVQKNFAAALEKIRRFRARGKPIEVWFQDEARIGQKNGITRRWARRGTHPSAPKDQRTRSANLFGAICPEKGKGAAIVMPRCDTHAMALHLKEISREVARGCHAVVLLDQAGWHTSAKLTVPRNITLMPIPPRCPELNPMENVWQFLRDNRLSNRIFQSYEEILDQCCDAWNSLVAEPWRIMTIGIREWAHRS